MPPRKRLARENPAHGQPSARIRTHTLLQGWREQPQRITKIGSHRLHQRERVGLHRTHQRQLHVAQHLHRVLLRLLV